MECSQRFRIVNLVAKAVWGKAEQGNEEIYTVCTSAGKFEPDGPLVGQNKNKFSTVVELLSSDIIEGTLIWLENGSSAACTASANKQATGTEFLYFVLAFRSFFYAQNAST